MYVPQNFFLSTDLPSVQSGAIHPSIYPTNCLLSTHTVLVHFKCLLHTGFVLGIENKLGLTALEEFEAKNGHIANKQRTYTSQSGSQPRAGDCDRGHDFRCIPLSRGTWTTCCTVIVIGTVVEIGTDDQECGGSCDVHSFCYPTWVCLNCDRINS